MRSPFGGTLPLRSALPTLGCCLLALALSGCSGNRDALEKRLSALQNDLSKLQNHSDRLEERLEALEMRKEPAAPAGTALGQSVIDHPPLKVVKLEPQAGDSAPPSSTPVAELGAGEAADDKAPRPMIRIHGSRVEGDGDSAPRRRGE